MAKPILQNSTVHFELTKFQEAKLLSQSEVNYLEKTIAVYSGGGSFCKKVSNCIKRMFDAIAEFFCCESKWTKSVKILNRAQVRFSHKLSLVAQNKLNITGLELTTQQRSALTRWVDFGSRVQLRAYNSTGARQLSTYVHLNKKKESANAVEEKFIMSGKAATQRLIAVDIPGVEVASFRLELEDGDRVLGNHLYRNGKDNTNPIVILDRHF